MDMKKLIEAVDQFAGQAVGQKPGDQVRGTEKATKKKSGQHPFAGRLVGASESKSLLAELEKELVEGAVKRNLAEQFAEFKEESEDMFAQPDRPKHLIAASKWRRGGEVTGTSFKGYVLTDYDTLVKTFGEPYYVSDDPDDKVSAEWVITFKDGKVATIYVYKTRGVTPKESYRWHVGGVSREVVDRIATLLGTRPVTDIDEAIEGFGRNIYFRVDTDKLPLAQAVGKRISFHPTKKDGFWKYSVMKNERPDSVMQKLQQLEKFFGPRVDERELSKPAVAETGIVEDDMFADRQSQKIGNAIIQAGLGAIEDAPHRWDNDEDMIRFAIGDGNDMIDVGKAFIEQGMDAGQEAFWNVDTAVRDEMYNAVLDIGIDLNDVFNNLDEELAAESKFINKQDRLKESSQFSDLAIAIMEGGNSLEELTESRLIHSDAKVNVFYKPEHTQTKAQMVAHMVPNNQVDRIIASLVDKFKVSPSNFEWHPADRDQYKFTNESQNNPIDTVTMDIPLMIRLFEYAREDAKTDMDLHDIAERLIKLGANGQTITMADYDKICPESNTDEKVKEDVPTAGGIGGTAAMAPSTAQTTAPMDPAKAALAKQNQAKLQQNLANLKSAGVQIDPAKAAQTLQKTDTGAPMNAADKDTIAQMAPAIGNVLANPSTASQLNTLIKKAGGGI